MKILRTAQFLRTAFPVLMLFFAASGVPAQALAPQIVSVTFLGNEFIGTPQVKKFLLYSLEGRPYVPANLTTDLQNVTWNYQDKGFLRAKVGPPEVRIQGVANGSTAEIRIPVSEGPVFRVGSIKLTAVESFSPETLMQLCPLAKGVPYSRTRASQWQAKIAEAYHAIGYLRFSTNLQETVNDAAGTVDLMLECAEGKQYKVGKITFTGDPAVNGTELRRRMLVSEGGLFNPEFLALSLQFINEMRRYKPMSESDVTVTIDDAGGTVDLAFNLSLPKN